MECPDDPTQAGGAILTLSAGRCDGSQTVPGPRGQQAGSGLCPYHWGPWPSGRCCPHAHCLMARSHSHAVFQTKASHPFRGTTDQALSLSYAPDTSQSASTCGAMASFSCCCTCRGCWPLPISSPPLRRDSSVLRPF